MSTTTPVAAAEKTIVERQIDRAKMLERERADNQEKIAKNREYLRLMADNGELNASEKKWLDTFYPEKEKGVQRSDEQIEATKKARAAARKSD